MVNFEHGMQTPPTLEELKAELVRVEKIGDGKIGTWEKTDIQTGMAIALYWAVGINTSKPSDRLS
ncbi:MAG: hypothetical protein ACSHYC_22065 [Alphaproteobacteria bacterium]